jgi:hypothetical protein
MRVIVAIIVALVIIILVCIRPSLVVGVVAVAAAGAAMFFTAGAGKTYTGGGLTSVVQTVVTAFVNDPASYEDPNLIRQEFEEHEAQVAEIRGDPILRRDHENRLTGNVGYWMEDDEIQHVLAAKLAEWRARGVLITADEFARLDPSKYHRQLSKHIAPQDTYADVTRIFGAEYLEELAVRDNTADKLKVPHYKLVVDDLTRVRALLTSVVEQANGREEGLVWRAVDGALYADRIVGRPAITDITERVESVVKINPATRDWARLIAYPKGDFVQTIANSEFSDYGTGVGPNALGDNVIEMNGAYYFIDTELKSFRFRFKRSPLNYYLIYRFKALRGRPIFDRIPMMTYTIDVK